MKTPLLEDFGSSARTAAFDKQVTETKNANKKESVVTEKIGVADRGGAAGKARNSEIDTAKETADKKTTRTKTKTREKQKTIKKSHTFTPDDVSYIEKLALKLGQKRGKSMPESEALRTIISEHRNLK